MSNSEINFKWSSAQEFIFKLETLEEDRFFIGCSYDKQSFYFDYKGQEAEFDNLVICLGALKKLINPNNKSFEYIKCNSKECVDCEPINSFLKTEHE